MGLLDKVITKQPDQNQLTPQEIQLALHLLKQAVIKGEQVETFYNLVLKLQNQFISSPKE